MANHPAEPRPALGTLDVAAITVGVVLGAGIFRFPSLVAGNVDSESTLLLLWLLGGGISLLGALCYAELATTYRSAGGDYDYLKRAFGGRLAFMFAWARMSVIQTGSIALGAFIVGDYLTQVAPLGVHSAGIYAVIAVGLITALNLLGINQGRVTQNALTALTVLGLLAVIAGGLALAPAAPAAATSPEPGRGAIGLAMVFILLTYGGWNEAAYVAGEVKDARRNIVRALLGGILAITAIYLLVNYAMLRALGLEGMAGSEAVAADLVRRSVGEGGAVAISILIALAALSTTNATVITGARTSYAMGRDHSVFRGLGEWRDQGSTPANALLVQGAIALGLIVWGTFANRSGFETMVDYTAPVFWFFFFMVGVSLFVLRSKDPDRDRPFRVPLYPITPLLFCGFALYMLYSSLAYTGLGALVGVAVLLAGLPFLLVRRAEQPAIQGEYP